MKKAIIYHNPRCSKSRETLALLQEHQVDVDIIEYLKEPLRPETLKSALEALAMRPQELIRTGEAIYKELQLHNFQGSDQELIAIMAQHPILIQRPVVIYGQQARIGRPPESVLELFR